MANQNKSEPESEPDAQPDAQPTPTPTTKEDPFTKIKFEPHEGSFKVRPLRRNDD